MPTNQLNIPTGTSPEDIRQRKEIILSFYHDWKEAHPEHRVYNTSLKEYIYVKHISLSETATHASKNFWSTLAVMQLDSILRCANKVSYKKVKENSAQSKFRAMIVMEHNLPAIGLVKLTVGVEHKSLIKVQYCITALEVQ